MYETRLIDPIANPDWLAFIQGSPSANVFHHPRWHELLRDQYGYEINVICIGNGHGIEAGIPIARVASRLTGERLVSLPFTDVCAPVLAPGAGPGALSALGEALAEQARRTGLELTVHGPLAGTPGAFVQHRFFQHLLPLGDDPAEVERRYSKSQVRRGIRKAERSGLRTERRTDLPALEAFYSLHLRTRRRLGVPTQPKRFIRGLKKLFDAGLGFVGVVFDGEQPIAAAVFLGHNGILTYKYGASDASSLGKRPNNLLFSDVIRYACSEGYKTLDFGRTDIDNDGLRSFKKSWGASEEALSYTYLTKHEPSPGPGRRDRIMNATIQRSPAIVGRLIGEALYRHFG